MHPDDLKTMWLCQECGRRFLYHSDVEDHRRLMNHSKIVLYDLAAKKTPVPFTRGRVSLDFKFKGKKSRVIIEYRHYPASAAVHYVDVWYSDGALRSMVEGDPAMMKNIDNYLRRLLKPRQPVRH